MGKSILIILSVFAIFYSDFYVICWNRLDDFRFFNGSILARHNRAFGGEILKKLNDLSAFQCTQACLSLHTCISQTFCENTNTNRGACFLHEHGITNEQDDNFIVKQGCIFQQFIDLHEAQCSRKCTHGERCFYDNINHRFSCRCEAPYHGVYCEQSQASSFRFTTLNAQGNAGPTSTAGYVNTTLQGQVALIKGLQLWRVPFSAVFAFTLAGGAGGDAISLGGHGVIITGSVHLLKGTLLCILVGQQGTTVSLPMHGAGGGGGTFVLIGNSTLLAAAGGGGGGGGLITSANGEDGQASTNGSVNGGSHGSGGFVCATETNDAGGGGGFLGTGSCSDAVSCKRRECNQGGLSFWNGGLGGTGAGAGGFGGGGAAHGSFPGGGGGYSGGGVSIDSHGISKAGGGGSYWISGSSTVVRDQRGADGYVLVQFLG